MKGFEDLREIFKDKRLWIGVGQINKLFPADDRSYVKVELMVFPEMRPIIAEMSWDSCTSDSGEFDLPVEGDMILFAQSEGDDDSCYVIKRLSSKQDTIPQKAIDGDKISQSKPSRKYWNVSDTKIFLAKSNTVEPTENLVLGQVFKTLMTDLLTELKAHATTDKIHVHMGNLGYYTAPPKEAAEFEANGEKYDALKASPVSDEKVLSDLAYTEKGGN